MLFRSISAGLVLSLLVAAPQAAEAQRREVRREQEHKQDKRKNTLIGAGIGLLGGAIISGGDPWATLGGAAAGGLIGNVATKDKRDDRRRWDDRRGDRRWDDNRRNDRRRWDDNRRR